MEATTALVVFIIVIALIFDYTNGMHDAANSIATVVSTRVLSPGVAVAWAAFFNFIAFAVFGTAVAKMIGVVHSVRIIEIMIDNPQTTTSAAHLLFVAKHLERIGDYVKDICELNVYLREAAFIKHSRES